jgi:hypothetical protein
MGFTTGPSTSDTSNWTWNSSGNIPTTLLNQLIPITPSTTYYFGGYALGNNAFTFTYRVKWYNSNGGWLSDSNFSASNGTGSSWTKFNNSTNSPSNASYATFDIGVSLPNNNNAYFGIDALWFSTDSNVATTFPTPVVLTDAILLTSPFTSRGDNIWSGTPYASRTIDAFAGPLVDVYTAPSATQAVVSTLSIANLGSTDTTYRVLVLPSGETAAKKHFIVFDAPITANSTDTITIGMTLNAGDKIQIASDSGNVAATAFGSEIS